jgi:hypothetical protein
MAYVFIVVYIGMRFDSFLTARHILFLFGIRNLIHPKSAPSDYNISASKIGAFQMGPETQKGNFLEIGSNGLDYI